jgi:flagellar secretion chaperone FliS
MSVARIYARTQNETASKERLMVLLFEAALRHMRTAGPALAAKQYRDATTAIGKASNIVNELLGTLDRNKAPELCDHLASVYTFVADRLIKALTDRDPKWVKEAERAFEPIATGFAEAVKQLEPQAKAAR